MQQLSSIIERELKLYAIEVKEATRAAALTVGKEIVEELRQTSPRRKNGGRYAKCTAEALPEPDAICLA